MFTLIFKDILYGFTRVWKLYLANMIAVLLIILLYAYIDGSKRQLNLTNTVFSGEVTLQLRNIPIKMDTNEFHSKILSNLDEKERMSLLQYYDEENNTYVLKKNLNKDDRTLITFLLNKTDYERLPDNFAANMKNLIPQFYYMSRKIHARGEYRLSNDNNKGIAELIGVEFDKDKRLMEYITLLKGELPANNREILIPSSVLDIASIEIGDVVRISGMTASNLRNRAAFKVSGIYNAPSLNLFSFHRFIIPYESMEEYYIPHEQDIEYCLFFNDYKIPKDINILIRKAAEDDTRQKIEQIKIQYISIMDVINISVQFNVFMIILIVIAIFVTITIIIIVNFNINIILLRKRSKEIGTLLSFGIPPVKISLILLIEVIVQLIISFIIAIIIANLIAVLGKNQLTKGFIEVLFVLLSGTNRIDFYIQLNNIINTFLIILSGIIISQLPILLKIILSDPVKVMKEK